MTAAAAREEEGVALEVEQLMADYPSVANSSKKLPKSKHQVKHIIETTCSHPVKAHYRRLDKDKLAAAEAELRAMEKQGIVRPKKKKKKKKMGLSPPHGEEERWQPGHRHVGGRGQPLHLQWPLRLRQRGQGGLCSRQHHREVYVLLWGKSASMYCI